MLNPRTKQTLKLAFTAFAAMAATSAWARSAHAAAPGESPLAVDPQDAQYMKKSADADTLSVNCDAKKMVSRDKFINDVFQPMINQLVKTDEDEATRKKIWDLHPLTVTAKRSGSTVFFGVGNSKNQSVTLQSLVEDSLPDECKSSPEKPVNTHLDPNEFYKMSLPLMNSETLAENADLIKNETAKLLGQVTALQEQARGRGIMGGAAMTSDFAGSKQRLETPMAGQVQDLGTAIGNKDQIAKKAN